MNSRMVGDRQARAGLLGLVEIGVVELHPWGATGA
jgi:DNA primase